jgi:Flp pilus assembly protein TadG
MIRCKSRVGRLLSDRKGASTVEFAIVSILLFALLFGIIEFSVALYDKAVITNASREGARHAIVYIADAGGNYTPRDQTYIEGVVNSYATDRLITFSSTAPSPTTALTYQSGGPVRGETCTVNVTWNYSFLVLPNFIEALTGTIPIRARTRMRME